MNIGTCFSVVLESHFAGYVMAKKWYEWQAGVFLRKMLLT